MAKVVTSRWGGGVTDGLTYPECPCMGRWDSENNDGICTAPWGREGYSGSWCGTRQHAGGRNDCPFNMKKEE